jgi:hypothetical protein
MKQKRYQPVKEGELIAWALNIKDQSTAHQSDWMLQPQDVSELRSLTGEARTAYEANKNRETKNWW